MTDPYQSDPAGGSSSPTPSPYQGYESPGYESPNQDFQQQQGYPQQGYPQQPYPGYPAYAPEPPGRTMGIVGFVLAFVIAPAGIVVSAMALSESKKVGYDNQLGKWGLWLSIIFTALFVLWFIFVVLAVLGGFFTAFSTYDSIQSSIPEPAV